MGLIRSTLRQKHPHARLLVHLSFPYLIKSCPIDALKRRQELYVVYTLLPDIFLQLPDIECLIRAPSCGIKQPGFGGHPEILLMGIQWGIRLDALCKTIKVPFSGAVTGAGGFPMSRMSWMPCRAVPQGIIKASESLRTSKKTFERLPTLGYL
jgi:hypothetical protein